VKLKIALSDGKFNGIINHVRFNFFMAAIFTITLSIDLSAQNPIIRDQYSADPSARVFEGKVYLYPSHDILAGEGRGHIGWFCMEDYHVFSSTDLTDWTDHGVIISQDKVAWADSKSFSMWAPDCIYRNGKYLFYFPVPAKDSERGRGFFIGAAASDKPFGPFIPQPEPIKNVHGIDPNPFIDKNGQAYLFWAMGRIMSAKLKENMVELASEPQVIQGLPEKGLKEGPFLFERYGIYYLIYPHVQNNTERLEYAISSNPTGPFKVAGVIMDESPTGCWTNQQSIIEFKNQWYLFYHQNNYSPRFDKNRSVCVDSLFFNVDGTIKKVVPTLRGVGLTKASQKIQIDRYSLKSDTGVLVTFIDTLNRFEGWKTLLESRSAWVQYNAVDFGSRKFTSIDMKVKSKTGARLEIRADNLAGLLIAQAEIPESYEWSIVHSTVSEIPQGIHNLIVQLKSDNNVEIDWAEFK
jgi:hypothetical protein